MGTQKLFSLLNPKIHCNFRFLREILFRVMLGIWSFFWGLACDCLLFFFGFLDRYLHRLEADDCGYTVDQFQGKYEVLKLNSNGSKKKENREFVSGFKIESQKTEKTETFPSIPYTSKYECISRKDLSGFLEEPESSSCIIQELFWESNDDRKGKNGFVENDGKEPIVYSNDISKVNDRISCIEDFEELDLETEKKREDSVMDYCEDIDSEKVVFCENNFEKSKKIENDYPDSNDFLHSSITDEERGENSEDSVEGNFGENDLEKAEKVISSENNFQKIREKENFDSYLNDISDEVQFSPSNLKTEETENSVQVYSEETDFRITEKAISSENYIHLYKEKGKNDSDFESGEFLFSLSSPMTYPSDFIEGVNFQEKVNYSMNFEGETDDEFIELDPNSQFSRENGEEKENASEKSEEFRCKKKIFSDYAIEDENDDEFDILLQHQETIEKMKMGMKNSRMKGLPTILEECETPKMVEDLKPLKIDEKKLEHKDRMEEIQSVYKSYSEKMKKLDILNYQTLNAISFMQLKDPNQQAPSQKSSALKSLFLPILWTSKLKRVHADPTLKSIFEMQKNLETVYVGQLCLSWETLHWVYEKTKELSEHDFEGIRSYNSVAGEFQQFQVLVQRFVENEQFLGPRIQNYAKSRCELRCFLQIPAIKEDCLKEKRENNIEVEDVIPISILLDIIDETMHVFWEFVRADKVDKLPILKGFRPNHLDLQVPSDFQLLREIKTDLQTKEKRLKDILRTGNCIVKKFQKHQEGRKYCDLLLAQVELKLVSRVLNMSKLTTDQLIWCQKKLKRINLSSRKVHVEPSFLLFPF